MELALTTQMKQLLRRVPAVRSTYRKLYNFYYSPSVQQKVSGIREWVDDRKRSRNFSLEFTITGRNDDYEPNWSQRLESILRYNHALFASSNVEFRAAFVEWNPPKDRPLLSPSLVRKFDFLRAIVVDHQVHGDLCQSASLVMMLNFGLNAAVRTSESDFIVISGGDVFLGRDVASLMLRGLARECLYRAIRVDIRPDLDFQRPDADVLEDPRNVVRVNNDNQKPYYNACGDFILMDRTSFQRVRGFDENIRNARLHLDSRCCASAIAMGLRCRLLGHVYHIDHSRSYVNSEREDNQRDQFDVQTDIPYHNPEAWGLQDRKWVKNEERFDFVS